MTEHERRFPPGGEARTTQYANTRPVRHTRTCEASWDPAIARLVERDYAFLPLTYAAPGYLFRGIDNGLAAWLAGEPLALNAGDHALAALEREAGVLFVSQDCSDAVSVTRLWQGPRDAAILVIPAAVFAGAHAVGRAAVLGFADPGVVFRYPAFAAPLDGALVSHVLVHAGSGVTARDDARIVAIAAADRGREAFAAALEQACSALDIEAAAATPATRWPRLETAATPR